MSCASLMTSLAALPSVPAPPSPTFVAILESPQNSPSSSRRRVGQAPSPTRTAGLSAVTSSTQALLLTPRPRSSSTMLQLPSSLSAALATCPIVSSTSAIRRPRSPLMSSCTASLFHVTSKGIKAISARLVHATHRPSPRSHWLPSLAPITALSQTFDWAPPACAKSQPASLPQSSL
jgi:hypothetical protein